MVEKSKTQFSLRAIAVLTAASAVWVAIFRDMPPTELAIVIGIAIAAGIAGHVVYARWLPWRLVEQTNSWQNRVRDRPNRERDGESRDEDRKEVRGAHTGRFPTTVPGCSSAS